MHYLSHKLERVADLLKWEALRTDRPEWGKELLAMRVTVKDAIDLLNLESNRNTTPKEPGQKVVKILAYLQDKVIAHEQEIERLSERIYRSEFKVIDGINQHPEGLNFEEWTKQPATHET